MKILITGGTGFVGTQLTSRLIQDGHEVTILSRSAKRSGEVFRGISYLQGDPTQKGPWQEAIKKHDGVINLAGASIFAKWTEEHKRAIRESRVNTTRNIVEGITFHLQNPFTLFSTSAVGYYGFCGDEELTEDSLHGEDFLAKGRGWSLRDSASS
jgi:NAD dependent epimerase/dehydratase family enzyme